MYVFIAFGDIRSFSGFVDLNVFLLVEDIEFWWVGYRYVFIGFLGYG